MAANLQPRRRRARGRSGTTAATGLALAGLACAAPEAGATPPTDQPNSSVVVTAAKSPVQVSLDRKVYDPAADLQAATGSADDVLRNIPSIEVDTLGNVSLRGDPNVQILIDGKPSPMMSPANRGAALQQMGADEIDRIEVLTTPPADYKPDGSVGVINIITKHGRSGGRSGLVKANLGGEGRRNLRAAGSYGAGPLHLYGGVTFRQDQRKRLAEDRRTKFSASGPPVASQQDIVTRARRLSLVETLGADYDASSHDRLSASVSYNDRTGKPLDFERDQTGTATGPTMRRGDGRERVINSQASAKFTHSFGDDGQDFSLNLQRAETLSVQRFAYLDLAGSPAAPTSLNLQRLHSDEVVGELTAELRFNLPSAGKGVVGYDLERDRDDYDDRSLLLTPPSGPPAVDPTLTNRFILTRSIHGLYASLQRPFGAWTLQGGVRLEDTLQDTNQLTSGLKAERRYFEAYPSLNIDYELSPRETLRLGYSRRVTRPKPADLNPYPVYQDVNDLRAGNASLRPEITDGLELGYRYRHAGQSLGLTAYGRFTHDGIGEVSRYLTPSVLLTTKANIARNSSAGLEFSAAGELTRHLAYRIDGDVYYSALDAANLGLPGARSLTTATAKLGLDYAPTRENLIQLSASLSGKRLTAQGYRMPQAGLNLGYRHKFSPRLTLVTTVTDLFDSQKERTVIDTAALHDSFSRRQIGRTAFIGLTWTFGGASRDAAEKTSDEP